MSLLSVDEAIRRILAGAAPIGTEHVTIAEADGRHLAEPLAARRSHPPFDVSAMDGYAVRSADIPSPGAGLKVVGMSAAGHRFTGTLGAGEAVRIFTGAPVPAGADAVLIQENAEAAGEASVVARDTVSPGRNIRPVGLDFREGDVLLPAGNASWHARGRGRGGDGPCGCPRPIAAEGRHPRDR